jgi:hypothetical protein
MPQSLLTGQLKEKPIYRVWCLYSSFVNGTEGLSFIIFIDVPVAPWGDPRFDLNPCSTLLKPFRQTLASKISYTSFSVAFAFIQ